MSTLKSQTEIGGMLGERVSVRKVNGRMVVTNRPQHKADKPSGEQADVQRLFLAAAQYAKQQLADPESKALYAARANGKRDSAYRVAMKDYLVSPTVQSIDLARYRGRIGDPIVVMAIDDFMVTKVIVTIISSSGEVIEEGDAVPPKVPANGRWTYKATVANPSLPGTMVRATAFDRPENKGTAEVTL